MADKDLSALLAELGGDNPQNRAIAEGLQKQGIGSTKDIEVRKVPVPGRWEGTDEASYYVPESTANVYFNKADGKEINPTRLGQYDVKDGGKTQGNIFFHLNADDQGNVKFDPQWSPRSHGFLRDNAVGQLIMKAGAIIPSPLQPYFVAANVGDALAHEQYLKAALAAVPYAAQEFGVTDAIKGALGMGPSGLDMGDVIPQGGIAHLMPEEVANLTASRLIDASADNPMGFPYTGAVDYIPLDAIKQTSNFVNATGPVDGSPLDVSEADQAFQKLFSPYDSQLPIDKLTAQDMASAGQQLSSAGQDLTIEDLIKAKDYSPLTIDDIVGSDWSAGTPTTGMEGNLPADLANYYSGMNEFPITSSIPSQLTDGSFAQPTTLTTNNVIDTGGDKFDLNGNKITEELTLDKALDLGKAYLDNPAALAGVIGTGLAATGLVNNVINPAKTTTTDTGTTTTAPVASMIQAGPTPGLQDLFDYANLYKNSPFAQQQTQQPTQQQPPGFTVSDVFRSLMADAGPQPKIEPNLVGLADLQKQMARK